MIHGQRVFVIVPARGGSVRLPRKNVLPLAGKPLIAWTIDAALGSQYVDDVFVSTDDTEIAAVAADCGVPVPELRPEVLATNTATTKDVVIYTLNQFGQNSDIVVLLQPTSPLRNSQHIDEALEYYFEKRATSVVSVAPCEHSPLWANVLPADGSMGSFLKDGAAARSQDLEQYYRLNGALYIYDADEVRQTKELAYKDTTYAYQMPSECSIDIDNQLDFDIADFLIRKYQGR